jgi:Zn-dependent protease
MKTNRSIYLGKFLGLEIRLAPSALVTLLLAAGGIILLLKNVLKWRPWVAITGGILATAVHYLSELWHQLGHARAAEQTGFPMKGMTYVGPFGLSIYPKNEGLLPPETHIQRALGGPIFSFLLALASSLVALALRPIGGLPLFLAVFTFLDNLIFFTLGALLPLGFTDGSTILTWLDQRRGGRLRI